MSISHTHGTIFAIRQASQQNLTGLSQQSPSISSETSIIVSTQSKNRMNNTVPSRQTKTLVRKHSKQKIASNTQKLKPKTSTSADSSVTFSPTATNDISLPKTDGVILTSETETNTITSSSSLDNNPVVHFLSATDSVGLRNISNVAPRASSINVNQLMLDFQAKLQAKEGIIKDLKKQLKESEKKIIIIQKLSMSRSFFYSYFFKISSFIHRRYSQGATRY